MATHLKHKTCRVGYSVDIHGTVQIGCDTHEYYASNTTWFSRPVYFTYFDGWHRCPAAGTDPWE